jgi:hypothetical protein
MSDENGTPTWTIVIQWILVGFVWGLFVLKEAADSRH